MIFHDWPETEIIPSPSAWYQYEPGVSSDTSIHDYSGNGRHLVAEDALNAPVLTLDVLNGHPGWYFDGTNDPLLWTGANAPKHVFVVASAEEATFSSYQGLIGGVTSGDILTGDNGLAKFVNHGVGQTYTKSGTVFVESNQVAPISGAFALLEVELSSGFGLDGIQIGRQRDFLTRLWKGHFVEAILFDRVLTTAELRRVRLYFNLKFAEWRRGLPLYFPSADITMIHGVDRPSRFYDEPADYKQITDSWEYEDATRDFNEVADNAPLHWEYAYPAVPKHQLPIFNEFWNTARLVNPFYFKDPDGNIYSNVRIEDYNRNHEAHKRWRHDVAFRLVGYNSVVTTDAPGDEAPPSAPPGLTATPEGFAEMLLEWGASSD